MAKNTGIGLDIGTSSVKMVELMRNGTKIKVNSFGSMPLTPGSLNGGVVTNIQGVASVIKSLYQSTKITQKNAVVAIAGQTVIVRHIKMPQMSKDELANAIKWEAERYIPFAIDEVNMDFAIIEEDYEQKEIEVMLVCAHNDIIYSHIHTLEEATVQPVAMDIQPFALMRTLGMEKKNVPGSIAILDIGAGTSDLTIIKDGIPRFTRIIPIAGSNMTNNVRNQLNISELEAENYKIRYGDALYNFDSNPEDNAYKTNYALQTSLKELVLELRRSFDYYRLQQRNEEIKQLIIAGGGSKLKNLVSFFNNELEISVNQAADCSELECPEKLASEFYQLFPMLTVAVGLALREVVDA
jgi:type IV pilus assembly protein PilM